jgi:hypothetical protein
MNNKVKFSQKNKSKTKKNVNNKLKGGAAHNNSDSNYNSNSIKYINNPLLDPLQFKEYRDNASEKLDIKLRNTKNKLWSDLSEKEKDLLLHRYPHKTYWEAELLKSFVNSEQWDQLSKNKQKKIAETLFPGNHNEKHLRTLFNDYIIWTRYGLHHDGRKWNTNNRMMNTRIQNKQMINSLTKTNE